MTRILSKSQINCFLQCPYKWKRIYIDNIKSIPSPAMSRGINIHSEIENFYKNIKLDNEGRKIPQLIPKKDLAKIKNFVEFEKKRIQSCVDKEGEFDERYFNPIFQELKLSNPKLKIKGIIDAIYINPQDDNIIIIDWKSGQYHEDKLDDYRFELALYKELFERSSCCESEVKYWGIYFVDADKLFFEKIERRYIDRMFRIMKKVRHSMKISQKRKKYFQVPNMYCGSCQFREECER